MDPTWAAVITVATCVIFILIEMPVALAIGLSGSLGITLIAGPSVAAATLGTAPYNATAKYALFAVPAYVLLGCVIANAGIGQRIYTAVNRYVSWLPGGLAASAVVATSIFSGISGSSAADVATFGRISVTEMARNGYERAYAAAVVAAAGTFAVLIPPSVTLVIYAIIAEESIGAMIMAGVVPGAISGLILAVFVIVRDALGLGRVDSSAEPLVLAGSMSTAGASTLAPPVSGPDEPETTVVLPSDEHGPAVSTRRSEIIALGYAALLFGIVVGGLYGGIFTATEAGAVGAVAAMAVGVITVWRNRSALRRMLVDSVRETAEITSMIFLLLVGGSIFSYSLALSGVPAKLTAWVGGLAVSPHVIIGIILLMLLPLGAFLDGLSVMLLTVPIIAPLVTGLGFDGVWFGILVLKMVEIGLITPPVGINAFIISGITKVPVEPVFRRLVPFVLLDLGVTGLLFVFPELVLWLPRVTGLV